MKKRSARIAAFLLCGCMMSTSFLPGVGLTKVQAKEGSEAEWEQVSSILDSYPGVYAEDTKFGPAWNTKYSPDGPLMGNGTVYAFMAGDHKEQNLYISHSNMWQDGGNGNGQEYTTFGGITIETYPGENLALNKEVEVSSAIKDTEDGPYMVDGDVNTKWCTTQEINGNVGDHFWAVVDLGEPTNISRWVVRHAQAGGEPADRNTSDFRLQYTTEEKPDGKMMQTGKM